MSNTETDTGGDEETPIDYDGIADDISADRAEQLTENTMVETPDGEVPVSSVMADIIIAHHDLDDYKSAGLSMCQAVKERRLEAEVDGDEQIATLLKELEHSAFGIYLRVKRGDDELLGDRDGPFSGYFESDSDDEGDHAAQY